MKFLLTLWQWFDGNKTKLGGLMIALNASALYPDHVFVYIIFAYLGPLLAGVGLAHMAIKGVANTGKESY